MNFQRRVSRSLDEEHNSALDLMGKLELTFARSPRSGAARDPEFAKLMATLVRHIERDIPRHFEFEERALFPRLEASGEGDLAGLLTEEHVPILAVAAEILPLARAAAAGTLDDAGWDPLKRGSLEMAERLTAHIQKETMALLPVLDDVLDEDADGELSLSYADT